MSDAPPVSDPAKRHSAAITDGPDRAGARSMLKAIGFTDEDLAKPIVGVATTWIETMPCNINQRRLAEFVKAGVRAAGGTPMEFNTIAISDGVTMGTEGMKTSLVSREVIADSIELVVRGQMFDGVVCIVACDKTVPGAAMALGRLDVPGIVLYGGTINPGVYKGERSATVVTVYEAIGAYRAGKITLEELHEVENAACPGPGACGGQFTANTMSTVMEFIGLSPAGLNGIPAEDPAKETAAHRTGELIMDLVRRDVRPSSIVTRQALENGIASVAATGGSTNGVLHLLAIAHEYGIPLDIDEFGAIADRTPLIGDMRPGGRYNALDMYEAGGVALVMRELLKRPGCSTGTPRRSTAGRSRRSRRTSSRRPARRSWSRSRRRSSRTAGWPSCTARWRPTAASSSSPATSAASTAVRPACSTPRRPATTRSAPSGSRPATWSSSATRVRSVARACRRCSRSPPRSSARASATRSRC